MEVIDKYGLYHHKKVIDGYPSSNNGWLYTAFARRLGFPLNYHSLSDAYNQCKGTKNTFMMNRLPVEEAPPISRDELVGMASLGFLEYKYLEKSSWIYFPSPKVNIFRKIKALYSLIGEHRNYVWINNITDAYSVVFKLPLHDRYYMKKYQGGITNALEKMAFFLYVFTTLIKKDSGELNLLWLQLEDLNLRNLASRIDIKKVNEDIYPSGHPFRDIR